MKFEIFDIPEENICPPNSKFYNSKDNKDKIEAVKNILRKLHTHQDFCAYEKITLKLECETAPFEFKLYKGRYLHINNFNAFDYELKALKTIAEQCPVTDFVSSYNTTLCNLIKTEFIDTGKRIHKFDGCYSGYKRSYNKDSTYIYLTNVIIDMNRVLLTYKVFEIDSLYDCDEMSFNTIGWYSCNISKSWVKSTDASGFMYKEELMEKVKQSVVNRIYEFTKNATSNLDKVTNIINEL